MLNPIASEAIFSASYVDNYIDSVENLPDDVQRQLSRIRDIDVQYRGYLRDVDHYYDLWKTLQNSGETSATRRARAIARMQQSLIQAQELGDEKMQIVNQLQELIDHKTRQLDSDQKNLDIKEEEQQQQDDMQVVPVTPHKVPRTQSPSRENSASVNGNIFVVDSNSANLTKEQQHTYAFSTSGVGNCVTPVVTTTERTSSHVSSDNGTCTIAQLNPTRAPISTNAQAVGNNNQILNAIVATSEPQRTASKRSRRRNDTINQNHLELGGSESNSNNETGSGSGDKNTVGNSASTQKPTATGIGGGSGLTQKKNSIHGHGHGQSVSGAGVSACSGAAIVAISSSLGGGAGSGSGTGTNSGKKKKRKARGAQAANTQSTREDTPPLDPIDPDEPTYCLCDQISFGEMILCDNDLCPIEWFHFSCVSLVLKPKGKWYCPNCRGDRPNVMKPKAQFLKELERYNKEKEEKT